MYSGCIKLIKLTVKTLQSKKKKDQFQINAVYIFTFFSSSFFDEENQKWKKQWFPDKILSITTSVGCN